MNVPNLETNDETATDQHEGADHIDTPQEGVSIEEQTTQPAAPQIDWTSLYRESLAERRRMEEELDRLRSERNAPQNPQHVEITDEYFEKHGTAKGVTSIVESTVAKLLRESLGDIGELSQDFKRGKQLATAEEKFYQEFPQLTGYKDQLSPTVRQFLSNAPSVDSNTYRQVALSAIGALTVQNLNNPPAPQNTPTKEAPSVPSAPAPRNGGQIRKPVRKLTEMERSAMRKNGFDPNKAESIDEFFALVENDEGVTV
jgi:hypothetical protein